MLQLFFRSNLLCKFEDFYNAIGIVVYLRTKCFWRHNFVITNNVISRKIMLHSFAYVFLLYLIVQLSVSDIGSFQKCRTNEIFISKMLHCGHLNHFEINMGTIFMLFSECSLNILRDLNNFRSTDSFLWKNNMDKINMRNNSIYK